MSHPLIEGPIKILKVVTPGAYWVQCDACEGSIRVPEAIRHKPNPNEYYYPHQGDKVFVRDEDGFFYRGTVCGRRLLPDADFWKYVVQLTDTFQVKDFDQDNVYPYGDSSAACRSAHLVSLFNVFPELPPASYGKNMEIHTVECEAFENAVVDWCQSADLIAHITEGRRFSFVQCKLINRSIYGHISTIPPLQTQAGTPCHDLSDYLHFENLAVRLTFRFEHVVTALMTTFLIDVTKLLPTFDLSGKVTVKRKPGPSDPFEGFKVHPDDVALHQSLTQDYYTNIIYTGAPLKQDKIVRYLHPDGYVVLGTVQNVCIKYTKAVETPRRDEIWHKLKYPLVSQTNGEYPEMLNLDKHPEDLLPEADYPGKSLLSYDFVDTRKNFREAVGVFKEQLFPYPYSSDVEKIIVQQLHALGVGSLQEWQKLCLPTFSCMKNLVVIGSKSTGKLTMSLISALSWMSYVNDQSDSIHPQLVIFFRDYKRADQTASLCLQLADFRVVVSTSSFISEKQKEMAATGCDILITTPRNWADLVSQKIFDYSRLAHVIFDEFDRLHEAYAEDLASIFKALGSCSSNRRIQTVIVANGWASVGKEIDIMEFPTVCINGVISACCYYKVTLTAVFVKKDHHWAEDLRNIISESRARKYVTEDIILLCKDEKEGRSIIEKIPKSETVHFVYGNLSKNAALKIITGEKRAIGGIVVCTDDWIEQLVFLKRVDVMISWMTSSWDTLTSRFKAFKEPFKMIYNSKKNLSHARAYLFCDCEKLEELTLIKNIAYNMRSVNGTLNEHLSKVSIQTEHQKLSSVCPFVYMFGKCHDFPACPLRHVFLPGDGLKVLDVREYLNVDILRVHSAFRYSVRVREIVSNYDSKASNKNTCALVSKLKEIEGGLRKAFRNVSSPKSLKVGQMAGACIAVSEEPLLRRVTVKSVPENGSDMYALGIVDYEEPDVFLPLSQMFSLPENVAKYPKDVIDLHITGLKPLDFRSDWQNDTYNYVTYAINQIIKSSNFLAGKVKIIGDRLVLVDSLYCFKDGPIQKTMLSVISTEFFSLNDFILVSGYCVENSLHLDLLSEMIAKRETPANGVRPPLDPEGGYGCRTDLPTEPVPAEVSSYDDPGHLYVKLTAESEKLAALETRLSSALERCRQKLPLIGVDELCAVKYKEAWNRALIFDIAAHLENPSAPVLILFVDYGDTLLDAQPDELYRLPEDLANVPFFAFQCELVGIMPAKGDEWDAKAVDAFGAYVRNSNGEMTTLTVEFHGTENADQRSSYHRKHLVTLWTPHHQEHSINFLLARRQLARFDPETKHMLKGTINGINTRKPFPKFKRNTRPRSMTSKVGISKKL